MDAFASNDDVALTLNDLPARPRSLGPDDLSDVFGGCGGNGDPCDEDCDCCWATCYPNGRCG